MELDARVQTQPCVLCGRDVSHLPRVRDRRGRYWCKSCYNRAMLALKARRAESTGRCTRNRRCSDDRAVLHPALTLEERQRELQSKSHEKECPDCHHALSPEAVLCVACGHDLRTGTRAPATLVESDLVNTADRQAPPARRSHTHWLLAGALLLTIAAGVTIYLLTSTT